MGTRAWRVMSRGVYLLEPAPPLVRHTVITSEPARAHLASVPPTVNSWSSGCAWMLITRLGAGGSWADRKSTRLNSSHSSISYAVFCLKKKKKHTTPTGAAQIAIHSDCQLQA